MFLKNLNQLRSIQWGKTYLWDIKFHDINLPVPFDSFFPALDVEEALASLEPHPIDGFLRSYNVPKNTSEHELTITFADNVDHVLSKWISNWINIEIFGNENHVVTISEAVKHVTLLKLTPERTTISDITYEVYPNGTISFIGNSESGLPTYSASFVIAGKV